MKGISRKINICGYECLLYLPPGYETGSERYPVIYVNGEGEILETVGNMEHHFGVDCRTFILLCIQTPNWRDDYSPWPAPAVMGDTEPFGGKAHAYLETVAGGIKPFIDARYRTKPGPLDTGLIGYSLGGLAALFSLYTLGTFGKIGCISGSLWYDGWAEFMDSHMPLNTRAKVYLSLGKGESQSRNPLLARVADCTKTADEILSRTLEYRANLVFEWNDGGHFTDIDKRHQKALLWLMRAD